MNSLLAKITSVEINTVIVEEIIDEIFIPWEVYQAIYFISPATLDGSQVDSSLRDRYLQLRRQLELEYNLLLVNPDSLLYDRTVEAEVRQNLPILAQNNHDWQTIPSRLPEPIPSDRHQTMSEVNLLLSDRSFLNSLRKLEKLKTILDRRDRFLHQHQGAYGSIMNTTYAQTLIQLDGKITNRYSQAVLDCSDRDRLLQLHRKSVETGEQQWHELLKFVLNFIPKQINR